MKKTLIALSVASFAASTAHAQLDLNTDDVGSSVYASEIDVQNTGIAVGAAESVKADLGFSLTDSAPRFVKFSLTNDAQFIGAPNLTFDEFAPATGINSELAEGGDGQSFVLFEISANPTETVPLSADVILNFNMTEPNLRLEETTQIEYQLFESGANQGTGPLGPGAGPNVLASFSPTITVGDTDTTSGAANTPVEEPRLIEVALNSEFFEGGGVHSALGSIFVADVADPPLLQDGDTDASITDIVASHTIEVDGDFSAAENVTLILDPGGAVCPGTPLATGTINEDMDQVVFAPATVSQIGDVSTDGVETAATVCLEVTGEDTINESGYSGTYKPVAATGFAVDDVPFQLGSLGNTGTTITLNLALTPRPEGGVYATFFRITNPTETSGRVFMRLINDLGESSATIDMEDVYDDGMNTVAAQGSSRQFNIDAVYAEVQEQDPTFSIPAAGSPQRKLRVVITGEFGEMNVQTYTVSNDEEMFGTFGGGISGGGDL